MVFIALDYCENNKKIISDSFFLLVLPTLYKLIKNVVGGAIIFLNSPAFPSLSVLNFTLTEERVKGTVVWNYLFLMSVTEKSCSAVFRVRFALSHWTALITDEFLGKENRLYSLGIMHDLIPFTSVYVIHSEQKKKTWPSRYLVAFCGLLALLYFVQTSYENYVT